MSHELEPKPTPGQPVIHQIGLKGHPGSEWTGWFEGLTRPRCMNCSKKCVS